jgi:hypothetical protein
MSSQFVTSGSGYVESGGFSSTFFIFDLAIIKVLKSKFKGFL